MAITVQGLVELQAVLQRLDPESAKAVTRALEDAGDIVATSIRSVEPSRTGRMRASTRAFMESATTGGAEVTARNRGYPYPMRVDRQQNFMARGVAAATPKVEARLERVLDDIAQAFGG
jgi:hypothetical protein